MLGWNQKNGFTLIELPLGIALAGFVSLVAFGVLTMVQDYTSEILRASNRDELARFIRTAATHRCSLARTVRENARFRSCFQGGSPDCVSGRDYGLSLRDAAGREIAGPILADGELGEPARAVYYSSSGRLCTPEERLASVDDCPIGVSTSFRAQGWPTADVSPTWGIPERLPIELESGERPRHEIVEIRYYLHIAPTSSKRIRLDDHTGLVLIDVLESEGSSNVDCPP